ncbi:hypothetical protein C3F09_07855 [candidate division GN15 bacterium]|uniref:DUF4416 family protein n=1 Tax=candidate division GN15 bacterium TaxID=2072418 RepID=A0A855X0L4_9BACT|nr:MAG: hypothetical protein C3F09_07855 [candidate division GN15 bacterium]
MSCIVNSAFMARIQKASPGRLVISIVHSSRDALADALSQLERRFGRVQCETIDIPHSNNVEYREEMGDSLQRRFFSFENQIQRDGLVEIKDICHRVEAQLGDHIHDYTFRTVNIDPLLMTPANLVLASHREFNHRIYLGSGVFAEVCLIWSRGKFCRLPWTNPDFCHDEAVDFFVRVRSSFDVADESEQAVSPELHMG